MYLLVFRSYEVHYAMFNHVWFYMARHIWRNNMFLGVNQQPSVSNWQLPLKARRLNQLPFGMYNNIIFYYWSIMLLNFNMM